MIAKGAQQAGASAKLLSIDDISASDLDQDQVFAIGCPAMGEEALEEEIVEPFVEELEKNVKGKTLGLFGSYGWGDGEWMRSWTARMQNAGATVVDGEGVICADAPDDEAEAALKALAEKLVGALA
jgi:flavodoxin short chain